MAKDKKSFLLYADLIHTIEKLTDEQAGKLFKHVLRYVNDQHPESDQFTEVVFEPIKQTLKRDLEKYEGIRQRNSENAKKRWDATACERMPKMPTLTKNADNDSVNDNDINNTKLKFSFLSALLNYGFDENLSREWMKVRKDKKAVNTETAFKSFIKQVEKHGGDKNDILKTCVEKSWKGFEASWMPNNPFNLPPVIVD